MTLRTRRLVGIGAIGVLAAVIALGITRPSNPFAERHTYYAVFDTVQGLGAIDRDVRVAGVKVGTIGKVVRRGDDARVEFVLDENVPLHRDARAALRPHTLFEGSDFVDLEPGSPSAPALGEGDTIPRSQTSDYVTLDQALRVLRPDIRRNLRTLARVGARTFRGEAIGGIQGTLRGAPELMRELAPAARAAQGTHGRELAGAVRGLSRTVDALAAQDVHLVPLLQRTDRTAAALTVDGARPLDRTLAAMPGALRELRAAAPPVGDVVSRARRLAVALTPALPDTAAALREVRPVLHRAIPVARQATPLVRDGRLIASRLAQSRSALVEMFGLTEPSLEKFDDLFGVFNTPTSLGAPSGVTQLVGGAFSGFNAVFRSFQTPEQNPSAPGHQGHVGVYVNPSGLTGLADALGTGSRDTPLLHGGKIDCGSVARLSGRAAEQLRAFGACR